MPAAQNRTHKLRSAGFCCDMASDAPRSMNRKNTIRAPPSPDPQNWRRKRQQLAAQNVLHRKRRREQQLQRTLSAVLGQWASRFQGKPDFDEQVQAASPVRT
jgi:hypothetical protein